MILSSISAARIWKSKDLAEVTWPYIITYKHVADRRAGTPGPLVRFPGAYDLWDPGT